MGLGIFPPTENHPRFGFPPHLFPYRGSRFGVRASDDLVMSVNSLSSGQPILTRQKNLRFQLALGDVCGRVSGTGRRVRTTVRRDTSLNRAQPVIADRVDQDAGVAGGTSPGGFFIIFPVWLRLISNKPLWLELALVWILGFCSGVLSLDIIGMYQSASCPVAVPISAKNPFFFLRNDSAQVKDSVSS